ncbi:MAG: hypothetical protein NC908_03000, partial [Candidatus Omnitrophica bacterium]|nr:hypothetical protein [Candidatus Omnitrophota bacterium]
MQLGYFIYKKAKRMSNWRQKLWVKMVALTLAGVFSFSEVTWTAKADYRIFLPETSNPGYQGGISESEVGDFFEQLYQAITSFLLPRVFANEITFYNYYNHRNQILPVSGRRAWLRVRETNLSISLRSDKEQEIESVVNPTHNEIPSPESSIVSEDFKKFPSDTVSSSDTVDVAPVIPPDELPQITNDTVNNNNNTVNPLNVSTNDNDTDGIVNSLNNSNNNVDNVDNNNVEIEIEKTAVNIPTLDSDKNPGPIEINSTYDILDYNTPVTSASEINPKDLSDNPTDLPDKDTSDSFSQPTILVDTRIATEENLLFDLFYRGEGEDNQKLDNPELPPDQAQAEADNSNNLMKALGPSNLDSDNSLESNNLESNNTDTIDTLDDNSQQIIYLDGGEVDTSFDNNVSERELPRPEGNRLHASALGLDFVIPPLEGVVIPKRQRATVGNLSTDNQNTQNDSSEQATLPQNTTLNYEPSFLPIEDTGFLLQDQCTLPPACGPPRAATLDDTSSTATTQISTDNSSVEKTLTNLSVKSNPLQTGTINTVQTNLANSNSTITLHNNGPPVNINCAVFVLHQLLPNIDPAILAQQLAPYTDINGQTSMLGIQQVAASYGLKLNGYNLSYKDFVTLGISGIVHVINIQNGQGHYIKALSANNDTVSYIDNGVLVTESLADFRRKYQWTGNVLVEGEIVGGSVRSLSSAEMQNIWGSSYSVSAGSSPGTVNITSSDGRTQTLTHDELEDLYNRLSETGDDPELLRTTASLLHPFSPNNFYRVTSNSNGGSGSKGASGPSSGNSSDGGDAGRRTDDRPGGGDSTILDGIDTSNPTTAQAVQLFQQNGVTKYMNSTTVSYWANAINQYGFDAAAQMFKDILQNGHKYLQGADPATVQGWDNMVRGAANALGLTPTIPQGTPEEISAWLFNTFAPDPASNTQANRDFWTRVIIAYGGAEAALRMFQDILANWNTYYSQFGHDYDKMVETSAEKHGFLRDINPLGSSTDPTTGNTTTVSTAKTPSGQPVLVVTVTNPAGCNIHRDTYPLVPSTANPTMSYSYVVNGVRFDLIGQSVGHLQTATDFEYDAGTGNCTATTVVFDNQGVPTHMQTRTFNKNGRLLTIDEVLFVPHQVGSDGKPEPLEGSGSSNQSNQEQNPYILRAKEVVSHTPRINQVYQYGPAPHQYYQSPILALYSGIEYLSSTYISTPAIAHYDNTGSRNNNTVVYFNSLGQGTRISNVIFNDFSYLLKPTVVDRNLAGVDGGIIIVTGTSVLVVKHLDDNSRLETTYINLNNPSFSVTIKDDKSIADTRPGRAPWDIVGPNGVIIQKGTPVVITRRLDDNGVVQTTYNFEGKYTGPAVNV